MTADLDTLLIALYVALTDRIIPLRPKPAGAPGGPPVVTDAEVVCLAVAQAHLKYESERKWLRNAPGLVGHLFPRLLSQSRELEADMASSHLPLIRPACSDETETGIFPKWLRQRIESVNQTLKGQLGIEHPGAHEIDGLFARVIQRLLALNAAIWHNWAISADQKR